MLYKKMLREMRQNFGQFFSIFLLALIALALYAGIMGNIIGGEQARAKFHEETNLANGWLYGEGFTQENLEAVRALDFVTDAQLRMSVKGAAPDYEGAQVDLYLMTESILNKPYLIEGEEFDPSDSDGIWLANTFAEAWGISVGDTFRIEYNGITFERVVKGLVESPEYEYRISDEDTETNFKTISFVFMNYEAFPVRDYVKHLIENGTITAKALAENITLPADIQERLAALGITALDDISADMLLEVVDEISDEQLQSLMPYTELIVKTEGGALGYEEEIADAIDNNYAVMVDEDSIQGIARLNAEIEQHKQFSIIFSLIFVVIAALIIATTMNRMVEKQRTQIGTLNALGMKKRKIMLHYISYSFFLSLLGGLVGILIGVMTLSTLLSDMFAAWYIVPDWKPGYDMSYAAMLLLVAAACVFTAYFSCRKLLKVSPAEALRPAPPKQGKNCIFEKLPFWNRLGFAVQYDLRDISRSKLRTVMGIVGTAAGMLLMVYSISCNTLMDDICDWIYGKIQSFENELVLSGDITLAQAEEMREALSGELVMQSTIEVALEANAPAGEKTTRTLTVIEGKGYYNLTDSRQNVFYLEEGEIALSHRAAKDMNVGVGDTVYWHIYTENDWHEATVGAIYWSPDTQGITYLRSDYEESGNEFLPSLLLTNEDASGYADDSRVVNILKKAEIREAFEASWEGIGLMVGFMILFSVLMVVIVLYNSGNLSFHERLKEFATLKVLGFQSGKIRRLIALENVWVTVIGIIAGAPFGRATLEAMMNSNGDNFDYVIQVPLWNYFLSGALILIASVLISYMFAKRIKRLDMVEALKGAE